MDTFTITAGAVLELLAFIVILRLWIRRRMGIIPRIFVSIILLVPFFGLLIYAFVGIDLDRNPDRMNTQTDSDAFSDGGGGHHGGGGH